MSDVFSGDVGKLVAQLADNPQVALFTVVAGAFIIFLLYMIVQDIMSCCSGRDGDEVAVSKRKTKKKSKSKKKNTKKTTAPQPPNVPPPSTKRAVPPPPSGPPPSTSEAAPTQSSKAGKKGKKGKKGKTGKGKSVTSASDLGARQSSDKSGKNKQSKKKANDGASKFTQEERIKKKMAKAARKEDSGSNDDGWAIASNKRKSKSKSSGGEGKKKAADRDIQASSGPASVEEKVPVDGSKLGHIIGPKGETLKKIEERSGVRINVPRGTTGSDGKPQRSSTPVHVSITGPQEGVTKARRAITELVKKGYTSLLADGDFTEKVVSVPRTSIPEIFGTKGAVIRALQDACSVRINVPQAKDGQTKVRVTIAGGISKVKDAADIVNAIVKNHHHPITHPGVVHSEIPLARPSDVSLIIGPKGSQIKHIQGNTRTRVYTPKTNQDEQKVVVVGLASGVATAEKMIAKILDEAHDALDKNAGVDDDDDVWGGADYDDEADLWN